MTDQLHLASAFDKSQFAFVITLPTIPLVTPAGREIMAANTDFASCAMDPDDKYEGIRALLIKAAITSHHILKTPENIQVYLKSEFDTNLLMAGLYPKNDYKCDFYIADRSTSEATLKSQLRSLRSAFNHTELKKRVFFQMDYETRTISVVTRNGNDMVDLYGRSRRMQIHQKLSMT
jgi:hypothetical protein